MRVLLRKEGFEVVEGHLYDPDILLLVFVDVGLIEVEKIDGFRLFEPVALLVLQELLFALKTDFPRQLLDFIVFSAFSRRSGLGVQA